MNKLKNQKGQALIEFAFVAVTLLVLVYGVTEFGRAWYYTNSMDNAVRAGARMASELYPVPVTDDPRIQAYVQSHVASIGGSVAVRVFPPTNPTKLVTVRATYLFPEPILSPLDTLTSAFSLGDVPTSFTLQRTGTMYYELAIP